MDASHHSSRSTQRHGKEYNEITLNSGTQGFHDDEEAARVRPHSVYVSSLDNDEDAKEEWPYTCELKEVLKTESCTNLYEKYVLKRILSPSVGRRRLRSHSSCTFLSENAQLLNSAFSDLLESSKLSHSNQNAEVFFKIGSNDTELDRALEIALLDMVEGERSEIVLQVSQRSMKQRDEDVPTVPCLKCIVTLKKIIHPIEQDMLISKSVVRANEEESYSSALNDKTRAIELFKQLRYVDAFHRFASGAKTLMTTDSFLLTTNTNKSILSLYSLLCSNMAECQLRENNPTRAIRLCQRALEHDPCNVKALYRLASAFAVVGEVDHADSTLHRLFELDPNNISAKRLNCEVQNKMKKYEKEYSDMMKRIFR